MGESLQTDLECDKSAAAHSINCRVSQRWPTESGESEQQRRPEFVNDDGMLGSTMKTRGSSGGALKRIYGNYQEEVEPPTSSVPAGNSGVITVAVDGDKTPFRHSLNYTSNSSSSSSGGGCSCEPAERDHSAAAARSTSPAESVGVSAAARSIRSSPAHRRCRSDDELAPVVGVHLHPDYRRSCSNSYRHSATGFVALTGGEVPRSAAGVHSPTRKAWKSLVRLFRRKTSHVSASAAKVWSMAANWRRNGRLWWRMGRSQSSGEWCSDGILLDPYAAAEWGRQQKKQAVQKWEGFCFCRDSPLPQRGFFHRSSSSNPIFFSASGTEPGPRWSTSSSFSRTATPASSSSLHDLHHLSIQAAIAHCKHSQSSASTSPSDSRHSCHPLSPAPLF